MYFNLFFHFTVFRKDVIFIGFNFGKIKNHTMETSPKTNVTKENHSEVSQYKEKINPSSIIISVGIIFSAILLLVKISWLNIDWKIPFIPLILALQLIFLLSALKNRFKKL